MQQKTDWREEKIGTTAAKVFWEIRKEQKEHSFALTVKSVCLLEKEAFVFYATFDRSKKKFEVYEQKYFY